MTVSIRRICAFIDGTDNQACPVPSDGRTNVRLLFEHQSPQPDTAALYLPGVGCAAQHELDSRTAHNTGLHQTLQAILSDTYPHANGFLGRTMGLGLTARILAAYAFICAMKREHPGAQVVIVGFSRGAYACCALAHFMEHVGMTLSDRLGLHQPSPQDLWTYTPSEVRTLLREGVLTAWAPPEGGADAIQVDFLGCWDTVCALVAPERGMNWPWVDATTRHGESLKGLLNAMAGGMHRLGQLVRSKHLIENFLPPNVVKARHALAVHEYRQAFEPMVWDVPAGHAPRDMVQMWFPGAHSDVGGGYREDLASRRLSDMALHWMMAEMGLPVPETTIPRKQVWGVHDSGNDSTFKNCQPVLRQALTREDRPAHLRTMRLSPALAQAIQEGVRVEAAEPGAQKPAPGKRFRASVEALHPKALHEVTRLWISAGIARAPRSADTPGISTGPWPQGQDVERFRSSPWPELLPDTIEQWQALARRPSARASLQRWIVHAVVTRSSDEQDALACTLASQAAAVIRQSPDATDLESLHRAISQALAPVWPFLDHIAAGHIAQMYVRLGRLRKPPQPKAPVSKI